MQLRPVPVSPGEASDDLLGRCWEVERACQRLVAPQEPIRGRAEKIGMLRYPPGGDRRWIWTVGEVDGYASVTASEGSGTAWLTDLYVLPGRRRRGIGRALVEAAAEQTRAAGCEHLGSGAFTEETAVRGEHRGRGLALWIKDHNIRWLSAQRPDVPYVKTDNDVTNTAMLAVNTRLGFVATSESAEAILDL